MTDDGKTASRAAEDQLERELAEATARKRRRAKWVFRGSVGLVGLAIATWLVGWKLPRWAYDRAETKARACFAELESTGQGDPASCVPDVFFHGIRSADREAANDLEESYGYRARDLATDVAVHGTLDAKARDAALRARLARSEEAWTYRQLADDARDAGAYALVLEMARAMPSDLDEDDRADLTFDGLHGALVLADLDGAKALIQAQLDAGESGWSEWIGCVLGLTCAPPPSESPPVLAVERAHALAKEGKHVHEVLAALGEYQTMTHKLTTPWTLEVTEHDADLATLRGLATLLQATTLASPEDLVAASRAAWHLQVDAARIAAMSGDLATARTALTTAEQLATDPRLLETELPTAELAGLIAAVLEPEAALGALDRIPRSPTVSLNRALVLAGLGRDAEALVEVREVSPFDMCSDEHDGRRGGYYIDEVCDALAWTKLALLLRTNAPLPEPVDAGPDETYSGALRVGLGLVTSAGPAAIRQFRWEERFALRSAGFHLTAGPMVVYVIARLAMAGEDTEALLGGVLIGTSPRRHQRLMAAAADLRGDAAAADAWRARGARLDAAMATSPEARRVGARSL